MESGGFATKRTCTFGVHVCIFPGTISEQHDSVILTQMLHRHRKDHEREKERIVWEKQWIYMHLPLHLLYREKFSFVFYKIWWADWNGLWIQLLLILIWRLRCFYNCRITTLIWIHAKGCKHSNILVLVKNILHSLW